MNFPSVEENISSQNSQKKEKCHAKVNFLWNFSLHEFMKVYILSLATFLFYLKIYFSISILTLDFVSNKKTFHFAHQSPCKQQIVIMNLNTSTPIKRLRFRGDSTQESDPLLENSEIFDSPSKNGEIPKERGLRNKEQLISETRQTILN